MHPVLSSLHVYPVKSAAGVNVRSAEMTKRGLANDRRWMLVDARGVFLSQRAHPRLSLLTAEFAEEELRLGAPSEREFRVPIGGPHRYGRTVRIWSDTCEAVDLGDAVAGWLSRNLGIACRLVEMPETADRHVDRRFAREDDVVGFADAFPLLLLSTESLADLNSRLDRPMPMNRFRPNLVIRGVRAFAEDGWKRIRIGTVEIDLVKPCSRCTITTVDQSSGIAGTEPLRTLATYRTEGNAVNFGMNAIPRSTGRITAGDPVTILD